MAGPNLTRPNRLVEFIGQDRVKAALRERIDKARTTGAPLPHLLLSAAPEMGKRALATVIAEELGVSATFRHAGEVSTSTLTAILSNLHYREVFILENVECLASTARTMLIQAASEFRVPILVGNGPNAGIHTLPMPNSPW